MPESQKVMSEEQFAEVVSQYVPPAVEADDSGGASYPNRAVWV